MRRLAVGLTLLCGWAGCGGEKYEPREGPRLSASERDGRFRYEHLLGENVCQPDAAGADLRRQARREARALARLVRSKPNALIKVEVTSSDQDIPPRDMTLREYAAHSREELLGPKVPGAEVDRDCEERYARFFDRLAR